MVALTRGYRRAALVLAAMGVLVAIAGCGPAKKNGTDAGGPPAGGWPQAENGNLTEAMCGLLTDADYAKYHFQQEPLTSSGVDSANSLSCMHILGDELNMTLQPTTEAAKLVFARRAADQPGSLKNSGFTSQLTRDVVPTADESWFDLSDLGTQEYPKYLVEVRRGALVLELSLGGGKGKSADDAKTTLVGLVQLVLERVPDLGKQDTGSTHMVKLEVTGTGKATSIDYSDPSSTDSITKKDVALPWSVELPFAVVFAKEQVAMVVSASSANYSAGVTCRISVDGKKVAETAGLGLVFCNFYYSLEKA